MRLFASPRRVPSAVKTSTPRGKTSPAGSTPITVKSTPVSVRPDPTTPLEELGIGKLDEARRVGPASLPPDDEAVLLRKRQGLQHDGIQHAEHRGAGADAQGQRGDGEHGDARAAARELSLQRVAQVASEVVDPPRSAGVSAQLLDLVEAAEVESGAPARLPFGHPGPDMLGHLPLDVVAQLAVELALEPVPAPQPPPPAHRAPPAVPRISPTASARRAQLSVCSCSRARPCGVSR